MVRIVRPQFNQVQSQVAPGPLISPDTAPDAFGRGVALSGFAWGNVLDQEQFKVDQIAVTQAAAQSEKYLTDALYGPNGLTRKSGQEAMEAGSKFMGEYSAHLSQIRSGLKGRAIQMFDQGYGIEAATRADRLVQQHISAVRMAYDDDSVKAATAQLDDSAATAAANGAVGVTQNPDGSLALHDDSTQEILEKKVAMRVLWFQRNHDRVSGDVRLAAKQAVRADVTNHHAAVIKALMAQPNGDTTAIEYLKRHGDEIDGAVRAEIENALKPIKMVNEAERAATQAFQSIYMVPVKDETEAERFGRAVSSVAGTPGAGQALSKMRDLSQKIDDDRQRQVTDSIMKMIDAGEPEATVLRRMNTSELDHNATKSIEEALAQRTEEPNPLKQSARYRELIEMAGSDDPATRKKFTAINIYAERPRVGKDHWSELHALWNDMNAGSPTGKLDDVRTRDQALKAWGQKLYPYSEGSFADENSKIARDDFEREMDHLIHNKMVELGREPSSTEIDELIKPLFSQVSFDSFFGRSQYQLKDIEDLPKWALLAAYTDLIEEKPGQVPTEEEIRKRAQEAMAVVDEHD